MTPNETFQLFNHKCDINSNNSFGYASVLIPDRMVNYLSIFHPKVVNLALLNICWIMDVISISRIHVDFLHFIYHLKIIILGLLNICWIKIS